MWTEVGFASMADTMFSRRRFSYGIPALDKLIQTKEMPDSFILYQEQVMAILQFGGFAPHESYAAIKAIAKKHPEKVLPLKERFLEGFSRKLIDGSGVSKERADANAMTVWKIVEDNTSYSFNASHSVSVALDSLYSAYLKAHYPYAYYATVLRICTDRKEKLKVAKCKVEMRKMGIEVRPCQFGRDNRTFTIDEESHCINDALPCIKGVSNTAARVLYEKGKEYYPTASDLLYNLEMSSGVNATAIQALINLDYFKAFGSPSKLMKIYSTLRDGEGIRITKSTKSWASRLEKLREYEASLPDEPYTVTDRVAAEIEYYGTPVSIHDDAANLYAVLDVNEKFTPKITLYNLSKGTTGTMKVKKAYYTKNKVSTGSVIKLGDWNKKQAYSYSGGKSAIMPGVFDLWLDSYTIL